MVEKLFFSEGTKSWEHATSWSGVMLIMTASKQDWSPLKGTTTSI